MLRAAGHPRIDFCKINLHAEGGLNGLISRAPGVRIMRGIAGTQLQSPPATPPTCSSKVRSVAAMLAGSTRFDLQASCRVKTWQVGKAVHNRVLHPTTTNILHGSRRTWRCTPPQLDEGQGCVRAPPIPLVHTSATTMHTHLVASLEVLRLEKLEQLAHGF